MKRLSRRQFMLATAVSFCCTATGHARWPFFGADDDAPADIRGTVLTKDAPTSLWKWSKAAVKSGCQSIAYTYSEPTTFYEYMIDTAQIARASGLHNIWVSNGYINQEPLIALCRELDWANVYLKSIRDDVYQQLNGGRLQPVLDTFVTLHRLGVHFEMTHLVVPVISSTGTANSAIPPFSGCGLRMARDRPAGSV